MLELKISEKEMLIIMRRQKGLNQQQVAEAVGVYQPAISDFERGKIKLTEDRYQAYKNFIVNHENEAS